VKFVILDTETTGIDEQDRVIQLGFMVLESGAKTEVYNELFSSTVEISIPAMETHGITPQMLKGKAKIEDSKSFKRLFELNSDENYLIIHNAKFDLDMLKKDGFNSQMRLIDTLRVSRHIYPDEKAHRLQYFRYKLELYKQEQDEAKKLGVEVKAHDAIGDVLILKLLLTHLKKDIQAKFPDENPIEKMLKLTNEPIITEKFSFGKHKDKTIAQVAKTDKGYLEWMLTQNLDEDLRYSISLALKSS
jgi:DNA polymerase-3 subunit epsilon/exodeoxyribonuclease X